MTVDPQLWTALGERLVKRFAPPPVVSAVLRDRCGTGRAYRDFTSSLLYLSRAINRDRALVVLLPFLARENGTDPIPWYGLRAETVGQIVTYYRGRLSPKAHKHLCRTLQEGMAIVHEVGWITTAEMDAVRTVTGGK